MERMIRCIEGHVFDAGKHAKCPECGWVPNRSTEKKKKRLRDSGGSFGQWLGSLFDTAAAGVGRLFGTVGIKLEPQAASGIVYAAMILFCVGAVAYPGSPLWPGNWGKSSGTEASTGDNTRPPSGGPASKNAGPAPGPSSNQASNNTKSDPPAKRPPTGASAAIEIGGENMSGFGAIAYSPSGRYWGEGYGYGNAAAAERRALKECLNEYKDCRLGVSFYRQCGAIAASDNGSWGPGIGPTPQLAIRDAIVACEGNNGTGCELERVTCTR